ncbi:MAG TPA: CBS domain-containing protein [Candidatus Bathyarchaeia archaeon]|nr:CBS domain-containing protein [Candidatus Bathyarchaeia archaeon]
MSLKVEDVMVTNLITIEVGATARKAAELMNHHDIGCLIVISSDRPVGIVTERDMLKRVVLQLRDPRRTRVSYIMSKPLITTSPQTDLRDAINLMNERRIKKLPVVEGEQLLGLLSITDIVRSLAYFEHVVGSLCARCQFGKQQVDVPVPAQ